MYNYGYDYDSLGSALGSKASMGLGALIWTIIAFLAALVGCFLVYFLFVKKDGKPENKKLAWLKSFLRFDKMMIETILKICYIFAAIFITLFPFAFLAAGFSGFIACLLTIVFGNLLTRIIYEGMLMMVMIWKNTSEIKEKVK
jgi:hypothetical protein